MPRAKKMKPFNHPHEFYLIEVREEHLNSICFGCKQALSAGSCYSCPKCSNFFLHKSCSEVPQALQHKAHSQHTLGLLFPPLCNGTPDACDQACNSFTYNCTLCNFNLHVDCASNLENEAQDDREQEAFSYFWRSIKALDAAGAEFTNEVALSFGTVSLTIPEAEINVCVMTFNECLPAMIHLILRNYCRN